MKRNALATVVLVLGVALAGCAPSLADRSYSAAREGAQRALSITVSMAAAVTNWLPEMPEKECPHCPCPQAPHTPEDAGAPDIAI